ncbi:hypothetical protein HanRHA438_Chr16g0784661 [Helianthus annuus]|uniref:Uncharacterized protein n=1 Tax=Helianthus annuus TaxID=4232 RepID=A0A9K3H2E9_HELAN|nr:hypothetical protein HanXRQr2_Chr16g0774031 [Helianthus annuus]KAJ0439947.1 hypothetical protein HanHA300_Chr16g0631051 [Helianthus annuus]KAJ0445186.1 hypothetical protein HanIR_Chr16g0840131 [Helianthus annuus]KAJ0462332.1 hypothetical protein HanHA89_Chr16g0682251 [Helianthus annuus]KAJ0642735.1 hypothetical protein HanLR1_Chr16g0641661 [Helianthus annuus]
MCNGALKSLKSVLLWMESDEMKGFYAVEELKKKGRVVFRKEKKFEIYLKSVSTRHTGSRF